MLAWLGFAIATPTALVAALVSAQRGEPRALAVGLIAAGVLALGAQQNLWGLLLLLLSVGSGGLCLQLQPTAPTDGFLRALGLAGAAVGLLGLSIYGLGVLPPPSGAGGPGAEAYLLVGAVLSGLGLTAALSREGAPGLMTAAGAMVALAAQGAGLEAAGLGALVSVAAWRSRG